MVNNQFKAFGINLNAKHVNGMTHLDFTLLSERLLGTLSKDHQEVHIIRKQKSSVRKAQKTRQIIFLIEI